MGEFTVGRRVAGEGGGVEEGEGRRAGDGKPDTGSH